MAKTPTERACVPRAGVRDFNRHRPTFREFEQDQQLQIKFLRALGRAYATFVGTDQKYITDDGTPGRSVEALVLVAFKVVFSDKENHLWYLDYFRYWIDSYDVKITEQHEQLLKAAWGWWDRGKDPKMFMEQILLAWLNGENVLVAALTATPEVEPDEQA